MSYNLSALNDKEFEELCTNLLAAEFSSHVERFKAGRDGGIDGRFYSVDGKKCIIQCKHWEKSGFQALLNHARKKESGKVNQLQPDRYIFITSLELSAKNKEDLKNAFKPWVKIDSDILGREDIEDLLNRHETVVRSIYKLWMTSASVLQAIFNAAIIGRSNAQFGDIVSKLKVYAKTSFHDEALKKLKDRHTIIITGEAGIGKTTLADQISLHHVANGAELVCIENSLNEAEAAWSDQKQVFYFDDFLGRNFLEAIQGKQDSHIVRFIKRVSRDDSKRFVLTSRTTILNQGKNLSDHFHIENLRENEFEIRIQNASRLEKAQILYNHIWHSDLLPSFIDELYKDNRYLKIIGHKSYNPRLVSFITDPNKLGNLKAAQYWDFIESSLNEPEAIWANVYESQIDSIGQWSLAILVANGSEMSERELRATYLRYLQDNGRRYDQGSIVKFNKSLRASIGAILNRTLDSHTDDDATIDLFNPSVADYILSLFRQEVLQPLPYFQWLDTIDSIGNFKSFIQEEIIPPAKAQEIVDAHLKHSAKNKKPDFTILLINTLFETPFVGPQTKATIKEFIYERHLEFRSSCIQSRYTRCLYLALCKKIIAQDANLIYKLLSEILDHECQDTDCLEYIALILQNAEIANRPRLMAQTRKQFIETWEYCAENYLSNTDILSNHNDPSDLSEAKDELHSHFSNYASKYFQDINDTEISEIFWDIDLKEQIIDYWSSADVYLDEYEGSGSPNSPSTSSDHAIHDLFDRK